MSVARHRSLLDRADELLGPDSQVTPELLEAFYRHVLDDDLAQRSPENLVGAVRSHRVLADVRKPDETIVRGFTPRVETDGWTAQTTVFEIVTGDVAYIVDSVAAAIADEGYEVRLLAHPQIGVRRDDEGRYQAIDDDAPRESWVHIEITRIPDQASIDAVVTRLRRVLDDVHRVHEDHDAMLAEIAAIRSQLTREPAQVSAEERSSVVQLLDWLVDDNFLFLGCRRYNLDEGGLQVALEPVTSSGLGILRSTPRTTRRVLDGRAAEKASEPHLLVLSKANTRSTVQRSSYLDYLGIKIFDESGRVVGEHRFLGLFTPQAYNSSVSHIPYLTSKLARVLELTGYEPGSHSAKELESVLEQYPRDDMFQASAEYLAGLATEVVSGSHRGLTELFVRPDDYGRFISCLVFLPRDRYNTTVRTRIRDLLMVAYHGVGCEFGAHVGDSFFAMLRFVIRTDAAAPVGDVDVNALETQVRAAVRTWESDWQVALEEEFGETDAARLAARWGAGLDDAYKAMHQPRLAVTDIREFEALPAGGLQASVTRAPGGTAGERRVRLYADRTIELTELLPVLGDFGVRVTDERPYKVAAADGAVGFIMDLGLRAESEEFWTAGEGPDGSQADGANFVDGLLAVSRGDAESDRFNELIGIVGLSWRQVVILRTLASYLAQTTHYSRSYIERATVANALIARHLVEVFEARFRPGDDAGPNSDADRDAREQAAVERVLDDLANVPSLDHDRMIREYLDVIRAGLRTNFYAPLPGDSEGTDARPNPVVAFKLDPKRVPHLPAPRPQFEIWVYGPTVEGVHLRFGPIARGGLRWSDRAEDFRTEVLGLVKAQMVKNAVIVPTGAKGGFYAKGLPDPGKDREAWQRQGKHAYQTFINALLDVTDNLVDGQTVHPDHVVIHDADDSYLVVAADKGTATFSDLANDIAIRRGFWLGDAFASGGSAGYDHKAMAITARGAWESVKRHFLELGVNPETDDITVVGIGDMSGDVFGNGMLMSRHIKLLGAFNHRHVFCDPNPDPEASYVERERLFRTPGSSWEDYETGLISAGGGVWARSAKSIPVSEPMREVFDLGDATTVTPAELIRAMLTAPVDLLWSGGIGTYVKATSEQNVDIGDHANDVLRVSGADVRCKVVGEGANLGISQRGRIEMALGGVAINTDAIDNSAGVECSDHEVNIKILLAQPIADGKLTNEQRTDLLKSMTDEVADAVLRTNYVQNVLLSNARHLKGDMLGSHERLMEQLEGLGLLDRDLEALPRPDEMARRAAEGKGLTSPEFSVLVAYAKMALKASILASDLPDDPWFATTLHTYFPRELEPYADYMDTHPLRREIIATKVSNSLVNRGGITFAQRAMEETNSTLADVCKAYVVARQALALHSYVNHVEELDGVVASDVQSGLYLEFRRLVDRTVRYLLSRREPLGSVTDEIERYRDLAGLRERLRDLVTEPRRQRLDALAAQLVEAGAPEGDWAAGLLRSFPLMGIVDLSHQTGKDAEDLTRLYFRIADVVDDGVVLDMLTALPSDDRWDAVARSALRMEFFRLLFAYTRDAAALPGGIDEQADAWAAQHGDELAKVERLIAQVKTESPVGLGQVWVVLRDMQQLRS